MCGSFDDVAMLTHSFGTEMGTASCGVDGGSSLVKPSTNRAMRRLYFWSSL